MSNTSIGRRDLFVLFAHGTCLSAGRTKYALRRRPAQWQILDPGIWAFHKRAGRFVPLGGIVFCEHAYDRRHPALIVHVDTTPLAHLDARQFGETPILIVPGSLQPRRLRQKQSHTLARGLSPYPRG